MRTPTFGSPARAHYSVKHSSTHENHKPVSISYEELIQEDSSDILGAIERAYDDNGLGLMLVRDVPGFESQRAKLLRMSWEVAHLPQDYLKTLERPEINHMQGWNPGHSGYLEGADKLQNSFYANIVKDEFKD